MNGSLIADANQSTQFCLPIWELKYKGTSPGSVFRDGLYNMPLVGTRPDGLGGSGGQKRNVFNELRSATCHSGNAHPGGAAREGPSYTV